MFQTATVATGAFPPDAFHHGHGQENKFKWHLSQNGLGRVGQLEGADSGEDPWEGWGTHAPPPSHLRYPIHPAPSHTDCFPPPFTFLETPPLTDSIKLK